MSHVDDLLTKLCPEGVAYFKIGAVTQSRKGKWIKSTELTPGDIPVITSAREILYHTNISNSFSEMVVIASSGAYAGHVTYWNTPTYLSNVFAYSASEMLLNKFLFYVLKHRQDDIHNLKSEGGVPNVYEKDVSNLLIPIPPLEIQSEIVKILDKFTDLEAELEAELEARLKQRVQVVDWLQSGKLPQLEDAIEVPLSELVHFENGKPHEPLVDPLGDCELITAKFIASNGTLARRINYEDIRTSAHVGDITIVLSDLPNGRALAKCYFVERDDYYAVNQRIAILRSKDLTIANPEYLYHYVSRNPQILKFDDGSTQTHLKKANVVDIIVRLPPLEIQVQIARALTALEKFVFEVSDGLPAEIAARRQQHEYYRNLLLTFEPLKAS